LTDFRQDWRRFYGDVPPLSFVLRETSTPWVRFHSLPNSKRHAETLDEDDVVLKRANTVSAFALGNDPVWLVQVGDVDLGWPKEALAHRTQFALQFVGYFRDDDTDWPTYAASTKFAIGKFNRLIEDVAKERAFETLWMSKSTGRIVAPYDGGIDVFLESKDARTAIKQRFHDWRPSHGDL
jgi:hypothetical protein